MKIDEVYRDLGLVTTHESTANKRTEDQKEPAREQEKPGDSGARVDLSRTSVEFSQATASMDIQSPERSARIDALKKQVQEGTYDVDAGKIADKMIKESLEDMV